jgi:peptidoglycan/xylan/chitin deacetylase (PgdA/CDA1 family)
MKKHAFAGTFKALAAVVVTLSVFVFTWIAYPHARKALSSYSIQYYSYAPTQDLAAVDTSQMPPAKAVPMLMYHGVTKKIDSANTTQERFIAQMEMLKRDGYTAISLADFERFKKGEFTLPAKPIVITFDDGRKDSYYPTDDLFNKLGFKATIFIASDRVLNGDPFYLTWDEMRTMLATGRWEIEAHGRHSHNVIPIDPTGQRQGRYLTSLMYLKDEGRLETMDEFEKRVEEDYLNNLQDLKNNLGVDSHYIAIPLNDYGQQPVSNNPAAAGFNDKIIRKYFSMALIEANDSENVLDVRLPVYNYKSDDPYRVRRIEPKNMDPQDLKAILDREWPSKPHMDLSSGDLIAMQKAAQISYGQVSYDKDGMHLMSEQATGSGKVEFGDRHWSNYTVTARIKREHGRSVVLMAYVKDSRNYISTGITDNSIFIRESLDGQELPLQGAHLLDASELAKDGYNEFSVSIQDGALSMSLNGKTIYKDIRVFVEEGGVGFKVWSDDRAPEGILQSLTVAPHEDAQKQ